MSERNHYLKRMIDPKNQKRQLDEPTELNKLDKRNKHTHRGRTYHITEMDNVTTPRIRLP